MPIYVVRCGSCESQQEIYRTFSRIDDLPRCCGKAMERKPCAPLVMGDIQPYKSMITGEWISSRSKHRDHLKRHDCIEVGNETKYLKPKPLTNPPGLKDQIIKVVKQKTNSL